MSRGLASLVPPLRRLALACGALLAAAAAPAPVHLASHHAAYQLTLERARGDVTAAHGEMTYSVRDVCGAWATHQRLDMKVANSDGKDVHMVSDYATWEAQGGHEMRYLLRQTTNGQVTDQISGIAHRTAKGGVADFTLPQPATMALPPGTLFPTLHTRAVIAAAEAGKRFMSLPLFDGTTAAGTQHTFVTITSWHPTTPHTRWAALKNLPSGRVHIAFFNRTGTGMLPDYQVGMRYWANGVSDDVSMDFGNFVMRATMEKFALLHPHC